MTTDMFTLHRSQFGDSLLIRVRDDTGLKEIAAGSMERSRLAPSTMVNAAGKDNTGVRD